MFHFHHGNKNLAELSFPQLSSAKFRETGFSVIEIMIFSALLVGVMGVLIGFAAFSLRANLQYKQTEQASALAQDAMEAVRHFRDAVGWNNDDPANQYDGLGVVALNTSYYPNASLDVPSRWQLLEGQQTLGVFTKSVVFENGRRDDRNNLVESGGSIDSNTKKVTVQVSWTERGRSHNVTLHTYLTNWKL